MEDILLKTIIDKLEALNKTNEKLYKTFESATNYDQAFQDIRERLRMVRLEVKGIPDLNSIPGVEIQEQRESIIYLTEQFRQPLNQKVKTVHCLNPPFLLSAFLMAIIIWLATWVYILYPSSQQGGKAAVYPTATVPTESYPKENLTRPRKQKGKILLIKNYVQDSSAQAKQMLIDSLYKILMINYE